MPTQSRGHGTEQVMGDSVPRLLLTATIAATLRGFLLPIAAHFRGRGWRVDGMARGVSGDPECVAGFDRVFDIDWSRNPLRLDKLFGTPRRIRELVEREGYDIVHVHTPVAAFVTRFALRNLRLRGKPSVIYTAHGFHFHRGGPRLRGAVFRRLERIAGRWTDRLVVINREDEAAARALRLCEHIRYMPGIGVDTSFYAPERAQPADLERLGRELRLEPGSVMFLMVAEFNPGKRHRDAIAALARSGDPRIVLALAGEGREFEAMRRLAESLGVAARVRFLGQRLDIPALVRLARAVVLPSEREGLPRSLMESLSLAVPAIGTNIRGISELIGADRGILVPLGDTAALADAYRRLAANPDEARAMGERGRAAMAGYDVRVILRMHEELYDEALRAIPTPKAGAPPGGCELKPRFYPRIGKRILDVIVAGCALVLLAPLLALLALLVRIKLGSPILFRQPRPGRFARTFTLVKFRTMTDARDADGNPLPDPERLTRFGRFLRSSSLDELPELLNVLRGDMSLVGPRPLLVRYVPYYTPRENRRHDLRPGITGWAQINGRCNLPWNERLELDVWYVEHCSFWLDLRILVGTVGKVLSRKDVENEIQNPDFDAERREQAAIGGTP
jgi:lipopolysaccharide/colanic/teichoic acid biosynthesis glycosyltransferase/glycosyltransferase involved in cell wall biosynthesis